MFGWEITAAGAKKTAQQSKILCGAECSSL